MLKTNVRSVLLLGTLILTSALFVAAQTASEQSTSCRFDDGKALTIRYLQPPKGKNPPFGSVWAPAGRPMNLFTETPLMVGNAKLPVGAYSLYLIPGQQRWELVVNKNVSGTEYDATADIVKLPLDSGDLSTPKPRLELVFGHVAPEQCTLRIYFQKSGMWAEFHEQ